LKKLRNPVDLLLSFLAGHDKPLPQKERLLFAPQRKNNADALAASLRPGARAPEKTKHAPPKGSALALCQTGGAAVTGLKRRTASAVQMPCCRHCRKCLENGQSLPKAGQAHFSSGAENAVQPHDKRR